MALDLFLRAETAATLRTVVRSAPFRNIIGDVRDPDSPGLIQIPGSVDWVFFPSNSVVTTPAVLDMDGNTITPAVMDPWSWLHLRISGPAEVADLDGMNDQTDRWDRSKLKLWVKENGTLLTIRGVRVWEYRFPQSAPTGARRKRVQIWRGAQMEALGVKFHEFMGGNYF